MPGSQLTLNETAFWYLRYIFGFAIPLASAAYGTLGCAWLFLAD